MNKITAPDYWLPYIPPYDSQYSQGTATDSNSCVSQSLVHIIEMLQGNKFRWSPRALAYFSATTIEGNSLANVLDSVNKVGLIPYDLWPTPDKFTWPEYYTPVPKEVWSQAVPIKVEMIPPDIMKSPLWTSLDFKTTRHEVAQLTIGRDHDLYFDSEPGPAVKNIWETIISQHSIKLIDTPMLPMLIKTQNFKGELRIVLEADNMTTWQALCHVYGVNPDKFDEVV